MSSITASESESESISESAAEPAPERVEVPEAAVPEAAAVVEASGEASSASDAEPAVEAPAAARPATELSPNAAAAELKQRFPALFSGAPKPLKLRIQIDIQQRAPGVFTKNVLSAFFRRYTGSTSYLIAVSRAPHRVDLDGQPAGEVSAEHRQIALDELARRRANQDSRREAEDEQRRTEEQQSRNRAGLLHDFQTTTLTRANFCALKGVAVEELDGLLEIARGEAAERARMQPEFDPRQQRPQQHQRPPPHQRQPQRSGAPGGGGHERGGERGGGGQRPPRPPRPR